MPRVMCRIFGGDFSKILFSTPLVDIYRHPLLRAAPRNYQLDEELVKKIGPQCVHVATAFLIALVCKYGAV